MIWILQRAICLGRVTHESGSHSFEAAIIFNGGELSKKLAFWIQNEKRCQFSERTSSIPPHS